MAISDLMLWPFAPNWRQPYRVTYEFKTDIFTSRSGREQRRAQRSTPRKALKFSITRARADLRTLNRFMVVGQGDEIVIPDLSRQTRSTAVMASGASVLPVEDTIAPWITVGATAVLYDQSGYSLRTIEDIDDLAGTVTFAEPSDKAWAVGTKLYPAVPGRLNDALDRKLFTPQVVETEIGFAVTPAADIPLDASGAAPLPLGPLFPAADHPVVLDRILALRIIGGDPTKFYHFRHFFYHDVGNRFTIYITQADDALGTNAVDVCLYTDGGVGITLVGQQPLTVPATGGSGISAQMVIDFGNGTTAFATYNGTYATTGVAGYALRPPQRDIRFDIDIFNQREVFDPVVNWANPIEGNFARERDIVDFNRGRTSTFLPVPFAKRTQQFQLLLANQAARIELVAFFLRMKGQRGEFYLPDRDDDFTLVSSPSTTTAIVAGRDIYDTFIADDVHRAVALTYNGTRFYRRITAAAVSGANTLLTTDTAWPCPMDATTRLHWLVVNRFAVDQLELELVTDEVGRAQISVTNLEDVPVEGVDAPINPADLDGAANWVLDYWGNLFFERYMADPLDYEINVHYPAITA